MSKNISKFSKGMKGVKSLKSIKFPRKKEVPLPTSDVFDLEQQFILRLPPDAASTLTSDLDESSTVNLRDKLSIELDQDMRHGRVRYGPDIFYARLLDLPCIIESMKTLDKKTFYKTADISQMLVCKTEEEWSQDENESPKKKDKDRKYAWNHGLTPSLKNVRKRRFRKTLKKKYMDQPEVEKEVRRLFRYDSEAIDVKYEIIMDDDKATLSDSGTSQSIDPSASTSNSQGGMTRTDTNASMDVASFFGELSSSEDEEDDEKDIDIIGSDNESSRGVPSLNQSLEQAEAVQPGMTQAQTAELQTKLQGVCSQLEDVRRRRGVTEDGLATLEEDHLKAGMQEELNRLVQEESEKEREMEMISAMLNQ